jgi:hypothetical protein
MLLKSLHRMQDTVPALLDPALEAALEPFSVRLDPISAVSLLPQPQAALLSLVLAVCLVSSGLQT